MSVLRVSIPTVDRLAPGQVVRLVRKGEPKLSAKQVAAMLGIQPGTWRSMVTRGLAPAPDVPAGERLPGEIRALPKWYLSTIERFERTRPKQGFRSDLRRG